MKKMFSLVLMLFLCCTAAMAQQEATKTGSGLSEWLKGLQNKIAQILPKKTVPMTTSVAGVRGAKEGVQAKLYWKGKKSEEAVTEEEMEKFKSCVALAEKGDKEGSLKQLDDFMKQYPDSALIPDAKKTFDLVKAEPKPGEKVEAKTEQKPEEKIETKTAQAPEEKKEKAK
jgi:TolA-binding protein